MSAVLIPDVDKDGLRKVLEEAMGESVVMQEYRRAFERVGVLEAEVERLTREAVHAKESLRIATEAHRKEGDRTIAAEAEVARLRATVAAYDGNYRRAIERLDAAQEQLRQAGICDAYNGRGGAECGHCYECQAASSLHLRNRLEAERDSALRQARETEAAMDSVTVAHGKARAESAALRARLEEATKLIREHGEIMTMEDEIQWEGLAEAWLSASDPKEGAKP